ncbi:MAG TPA: threonine dehydratase [Planctomycetaceae bacterium]|nr:threonine dehydratase [Planctomycetaceae bacterium]
MTLPVTYDDIQEALPRVRAVLRPTPLYEWPGLSELLGCRFLLKHENCQPVGAFKVRGGVNLVSTLTDAERAAGILACSTGNHGQSLAFACRRFGVKCTIVVPVGNNPGKNRAIRQLGATLIEHGRDFDEARDFLERELAPRGGRYVHSANEPLLIAGVGTMACEIFNDLPEPDVILVPIGLGSGVCGTAIVAKARRPQTEIIGVQAAGASAVVRSWQTGAWQTTDRADTWAEGMATRRPAEMTLAIMRALMDDALLVEDDELRRACWWILKDAHHLAEGAGAAALAAAYRHRERFAGRTVVGVLSGGNLDLAELPAILAAGEQGEW